MSDSAGLLALALTAASAKSEQECFENKLINLITLPLSPISLYLKLLDDSSDDPDSKISIVGEALVAQAEKQLCELCSVLQEHFGEIVFKNKMGNSMFPWPYTWKVISQPKMEPAATGQDA